MTEITLEDYMKLVESDETLRARVRACADPVAAMKTVMEMAAASGYRIASADVPDKLELKDDDLGAVMGGVNPFIPMSEGELNPYSWFVTLLRRLMGMDDGTPTPPGPDRGTPEDKRW